MVTLTLLNSENLQPLQKWDFTRQSVIRIGRHRDNDIIFLQSPAVSRHHLEVQQVDSQDFEWQLVSHGSNGTFLNGRLVTQAPLKDSDLIQLAPEGPLLKFHSQSSGANFQKNASRSLHPSRKSPE